MRIIFLITSLIFTVESIFAEGDTLKIMPLGDSITRGATQSSLNHGRAGYRKPLIDSLKLYYTSVFLGGDDFDMVGTQVQGNAELNFDRDHEGRSGWQASNPLNTNNSMLHNLNNILNQNPPDLILLHIGTNDIDSDNDNAANLVSEVDSILTIIKNFDSTITTIVAKIINRTDVLTGGPKSDTVSAFNEQLEMMVNNRINMGERLFLVDMENGAGFDYMIDSSFPYTSHDMYDLLHPNDRGYNKMAAVWFNKIKELLTPSLIYPVDDSTYAPVDITLNWNPALGANTYRLQIATDPSFHDSTIVFDDSSLVNTSYAYNSLDFNTTYYWRVRAKINTGSSPYSEVRNFSTTPQSVLVSAKIFLEGPYNSGSGLMNTTLNGLGYLPEKNPYDTLPWQYTNGDSVSPGFFASNPSIVDWVLLELRDTSDNTQYIARRAALLRNDGSIVDTDGISPVLFDGVSPGNYYIVINHRNHLAVMSSEPVNLNALDSDEYDFTNASGNFFGDDAGAKELTAGVWGMIAGDANGDGNVDYPNDILNLWFPYFGFDDLLPADFNLDGTVDYPNDIINIWFPNFGLSTVVQ